MPVDLAELLGGRALPPPVGAAAPGHPPVAVLTSELQRGVMGDLATFPALRDACAERGVVANTARVAARARDLGVPVVHCTAAFRADRAGTVVNSPLHSAVLRDPAHLLEGTPAVELVPELGPDPADVVVARHHGVSPFGGTGLDVVLRNLGARVLVVTGVSLNVAVLGCCVEAVNLGFQVVVPVDCVAGHPADYAESVLAQSVRLLATLSTADEVVAALG